jgi:monoterpene epsilon-lactone hydrolase
MEARIEVHVQHLVLGMTARIQFRGPPRYRLHSAAELSQSILEVSARRALKGPRLPGWNWFVEVATELSKRQTLAAFRMSKGDLNQARRYLDSVVISSSELSEVSITPVVQEQFRGSWFESKKFAGKNLASKKDEPRVSVLYFHGGGYSFYPRAYANFIALITLAAKSRTFALDYRLSPEHRFPAQLEDALHAYRWLLRDGIDPDNLIVAGDSAGGNLTLALLLAARDSKLPLPALAVALSPPTDFEADFAGKGNFDWIEKKMLEQWADWFCDTAERPNPLVSPMRADLRGLSPIYIQAGRAEILYPSIQAFADRAHEQGADVILESWEDMTHDFQIFGLDSPPSADALRRFGHVIDARLRGQKNKMETVRL